jgi:PAS domain S-box-containing protein
VSDEVADALSMGFVALEVEDAGLVEERERADTESRWRAIFDGAPVGMAEMDMEGRILRSNRALSEIMHLSAEDLLGGALYDHYHPDELSDALAHTAAIIDGAPPRGANERRLAAGASGEQRWISAHAIRAMPASPPWWSTAPMP